MEDVHLALFQNLLAIDDKIEFHCFTILGIIGCITYFYIHEKSIFLGAHDKKIVFWGE